MFYPLGKNSEKPYEVGGGSGIRPPPLVGPRVNYLIQGKTH